MFLNINLYMDGCLCGLLRTLDYLRNRQAIVHVEATWLPPLNGGDNRKVEPAN